MIRSLYLWLEHRTNLKKVMDALLIEHIPGGARWRYVWGSCLAFVFGLQMLTGILLMTAYSPGNTTAWGSVFYIQYVMDFGWLIRGLHHFGSQAMVVLLFLHMLQVVIAGAHLPPREVNWWLGLALMAIVLGLGLTGYLLPWDQKGFWATQVATKIMSGVPIIGTWLQNIIVGGPEYGNATLTRFFALHVAILPALLVMILVAHISLFRRHGITYPGYPEKQEKDGWFWPDQVFRDMIACLVVLGVLLFLVLNGHGYPVTPHGAEAASSSQGGFEQFYQHCAKAGERGLGANLDAPADPQTQYDPRPEWYYLFLFQLLKYFPGDQIMIGTQVIPGAAALVLFLLPLLGFGKMRLFGNIVGVVVVVALIGAIVSLTCLALAQDTPEEIPHVLLNRIAMLVVPVVAGVFLLYLAISAIFRQGMMRSLLVPMALTIVAFLVAGTGFLIYAALTNNVPEPVAEFIKKKIADEELASKDRKEKFEKDLEEAKKFQKAVKESAELAERAIELAFNGNVGGSEPGDIPIEGAPYLLQRDPKSQFKGLFMANCSSCHSYADEKVVSKEVLDQHKPIFKIRDLEEKPDPKKPEKKVQPFKFSAADLAGFGSKEWISSFLKNPGHDRFQGRIVNRDKEPVFETMKKYVGKRYKEAGKNGKKQVEDDFAKIAEWLATHPTGTTFKGEEEQGFKLFKGAKYDCTSCHGYENIGKTLAPDLTGYGGALWLHKMIRSPGHPDAYGPRNILEEEIPGPDGKPKTVKKTLMPSFFPAGNVQAKLMRLDYELLLKKAFVDDPPPVQFADLSDIDRELIVRYLTGDYRVVFGGGEITAVEVKEKK